MPLPVWLRVFHYSHIANQECEPRGKPGAIVFYSYGCFFPSSSCWRCLWPIHFFCRDILSCACPHCCCWQPPGSLVSGRDGSWHWQPWSSPFYRFKEQCP